MYKNKLLYVSLFLILCTSFLNQKEVDALDSTFRSFVGCTVLDKASRDEAYADIISKTSQMGIPATISDPYGRAMTHQINKDHMINDCIVVYGGPTSMPTNQDYPGTKMRQAIRNGDYVFLGFDQNRRPFPNVNNSTAPPDQYYFYNRQFIVTPWVAGAKAPGASQTLATSISASTIKPVVRNQTFASTNSVDGVTLTKLQEMERVGDYIYWRNSNRSKGKIGYLRTYNSNTNVTWSASQLLNYASVEYYPGAYTPGLFNIYTYAGGTYYYSTTVIPQHKSPLRDGPDLEIKITSINPQSIQEGQSVTVNYRVTNLNPVTVTNPVVTHYLSGATKTNITHNNTLAKGASVTGSFVVPSGNINANNIQRIFVEVNRNRTNPSKEVNTNNNIDFEDYGIVAQRTSSNFKITSHSPVNPRSKQNTTVNYTVCNTGNSNMNNVGVYLNWPRQTPVLVQTFAQIDGEIVTFDPITRTFSVTQTAKCASGSAVIAAPDIAEISKIVNITGTTSNGLQTYRPIEIRNPNASIALVNKKQDTNITETELGDLSVIVSNNTFKTINQNCGTSGGCDPAALSTTFNVKFYDITNGAPGIEVPGSAFNGTYSLTHGTSRTFNLTASKTALLNYIGSTKKITRFLVKGYIPYYTGEYDVHGSPMYLDNKNDIFEMHYIPPRPDVSNAKCDTLDHQISSYFNKNGGPDLIKACMGHYPNNPSTLTEKGMQSYNYVLYRFLPMPFPKYDIYTPELNSNNPNHFYQTLSTPNDNRVQGDWDSYIFKNLSGSVYKERGRYLPTGVSMKFSIDINTANVAANKQVAAGVVSYTIPAGCYEGDKVDLKYHYGCGEIMVFLPNTQANMMKTPVNYNQTDVDNRNIVYPINGTKIPYLNPGSYKFKLEATESYQYRYQTNDNYVPNTYNWSNLK